MKCGLFLFGSAGSRQPNDIFAPVMQHLRKDFNVCRPTGEDHWDTPGIYCLTHIINNQIVTNLIIHQRLIKRADILFIFCKWPERCKPRNKVTMETLLCHQACCICREPDRSALHKNNGLMTVFSNRCSS